MTLTVGGMVRVRSRQYLVEDVVPSSVPGSSTLVRLSCLEDDAQGQALEVLWDREVDAKVLGAANWDMVAQRGFDEARFFSAYLHTLRWNCVTATDAKLFQAPYRAGIEVKAYQLEPLRKALLMPRVNLFIADDVGLGKTIEAGLILREMILRQKVRRMVICCPPSVVRQWRDEMAQRFGLDFVIYDRDFVAAQRRRRGYAVNPWTTHHRFIISQALLRDETYAAPLRDWLGGFSSASMLILDEAHNVAPSSGSRYAIDSKLTRAMRQIAPRFEHKLFLSATPHNGHTNSFSALLEILDPQRFCRGVPVHPRLRDAVMVRRLKADLRAIGEAFPERKVIRIDIGGLPNDAPELALSQLLQRYREAREARLETATKSKRATALLVVTSLQKRLLSSIDAFARTLRVHRRSMERAAEEAASVELEPDQLELLLEAPGADDERAEFSESEIEAEEDAQMELATAQTAGETSEMGPELAILSEMIETAEQARHEQDPRVKHLLSWIREHLCPDLGTPGALWNDRRVLIFTEYTDTKRYLETQIEAAIVDSDRGSERLMTFYGGMGEAGSEVKAAFNTDPQRHPLRILIATDAAREGVNLQNHCADLFHFDIPWNPSRMEQRNGRIDRKLQKSPEVRCHYYVFPQRTEDRVLEVLVTKTARIYEELGSLSPVVGKRLDRLLKDGIVHSATSELTQGIEGADDANSGATVRLRVIENELEASRERSTKLIAQQEKLQKMLKDSRDWLALDDRHFRDALSAALELRGVGRLEPIDEGEDLGALRWRIPDFDERADRSWANTLDSLRAPRQKGQKPWEWRKESPILPVVFRDPGTLDGEVVHLHLEQRVVRRLLGRFLAQGFLYDELTRACVVRTEDPLPRVIVLGRLSLYGAGASRLHDEVLAVAAEWRDQESRGRGSLRPLGEGEKGEVLNLLERSFAAPHLHVVPDLLRDRLKASAARDVTELQPHLDRRAGKLAERAQRDLGKRGEQEAKDMRKILEAQRGRIRKQLAEAEDADRQMTFQFTTEEKRQLASDQRHWTTRLDSIEAELEREPERIRSAYEVKARRVEPVGLVYLWPTSS